MIARRAGGEPVELVRSPDEVVFLAFDTQIKRLVELHILRSGSTLDSVAKRSAFDRAKQASEIRGPTFMRILEVGEDQGLVYYTSNLNDGEFLEDFVQRRGPLPPATVFSLVFQLLDDLIQLKNYERLVAQMRLDRVLVSTLEDTFLQLRIYDYGLSASETSTGTDGARLVIQACELMFQMLTGKTYGGDNPDRYPALTSLPMSLRTTMRAALTDPLNSPASIEKLREDVREAVGALVSSIQARNSRKQLVVTPTLQPRSQLQDLLLENLPVETILGNRFRVEDAEHVRRYPFSIPCYSTKSEQPVTVHLLPPSRIVDKSQYEAVPLQMWRFNPEKHPNILRSLSVWESPDWTFLTEEREPGFALSRLLAERICLNPTEVVVLLRQVRAGFDQAMECGVQRVDLHPSNIVLRVGKAGPLLAREYERLMQKRLDAWPPFLLKLRAHLTLRNLYEPLLVDKPDHGEHVEDHLADRDYRHRAFVALAAYLLTGERQTGSIPHFPESVPEALAAFVRESLEQIRHQGRTPAPGEFLERFESIMSGPAAPDLATRLRGGNVALEEMESVGSVSDFEDEWADATDTDDQPVVSPISRTLHRHDFSQKKGAGPGWPVWAAAAAVVLGLGAWWLLSGSPAPTTVQAQTTVAESPKASTPAPPAEKPTPEPAKPAAATTAVATTTVVTPPPALPEPVKPATIAVSPPAPAPKPPATEPAKTAAATTTPPSPTPPTAEKPAAAPTSPPPAPVTVPNPVIIRKALLPTPEEIAKFKQGLLNQEKQQLPVQITPPAPSVPQRTGSIPAVKVATPREDSDLR